MTFLRIHHRLRRQNAFTLVELLVAVAVFAILLVFLSQVVGLTGQAISINTKKLDASGQARLFFDRLGADLAARLVQKDLPMVFNKVANGSDNFQFYSQVSGYTGTRNLTAVGYQIPSTPLVPGGPVFQLERAASGTDWQTGAGNNPLVFGGPPVPKVTDYEVLANGAFRLEFCYLLKTGVFKNTSSTTDFSDVAAIVVAVAVLDDNSRKLISDAQLQTLAQDFPDVTDGDDPLKDWTPLMGPSFAAGIPLPVLQNIRLYQRIFYVP